MPYCFGLVDGLDDELRRGVAEGGEDAAGVQPPDADLAEDVVPVEIAGFELAGGGVAAVGNADGAAHAEAPLGEIQAVAHRAADAVERRPFDEFGVHAALENKILEQAADVVVREGGGDRGLAAEAAAQAAGDIVFAAAFPRFEFAGAADAPLAGIKPEHDFTQREQVVLALGLVAKLRIGGMGGSWGQGWS